MALNVMMESAYFSNFSVMENPTALTEVTNLQTNVKKMLRLDLLEATMLHLEELKFNTKASGEQFAMTTLMQRREV